MVHKLEECGDIHLSIAGIKCFDCRYQDRGIDGCDLYASQPCNFCITEKENCYWMSMGISVI